ncbi:MAG: DUF418 domain-containing protein [Ginsengibacter sp.]
MGSILPQERIQTIDIIRGIALLGILIINFTVDNRNVQPEEGWISFADQLAYWPIRFFLDDKFMAMYCFLFGLGFSIQLLRAEERNSPFVFVYFRRLIVLYLIGTVHGILTRETILPTYAMVGVLLLLFYKLPRKLLPVVALLCFLIPTTRGFIKIQQTEKLVTSTTLDSIDTTLVDACVGVYERAGEPGRYNVITREGNKIFSIGRGGKLELLMISGTEYAIKNSPAERFSFQKDSSGNIYKLLIRPGGIEVSCLKIQMDIKLAQKEMERQMAEARKPLKKLSYTEFIIKNIKDTWQGLKNWSWNNFFWGFNISGILPLFLMGLYFGRRKVFYDISTNRQFLRSTMKWGLILGGGGVAIFIGFEAWNFIIGNNWNWGYSTFNRGLIGLSWDLGIMLMAIGYISGLILFLEKINWKKRLSFFAPVGRMGLTNYIFHTIPYILLFDSFGLSLSGKIGPLYRLLLALPVFVVIILFSRWWFKYFRFGPLEWLWRLLTYLKFQPMRLKASNENNKPETMIHENN